MDKAPFGISADGRYCGCIHSAYEAWRLDKAAGRIANVTYYRDDGQIGVQNYYVPPQGSSETLEEYLQRRVEDAVEYDAPQYTIGELLELLSNGNAREINPWEYKSI